MKVYKIEFLTTMYVEAEDEVDAVNVGIDNLELEVRNGNTEEHDIQQVNLEYFKRNPQDLGVYPWRAWERRNEKEYTIEQILKGDVAN